MLVEVFSHILKFDTISLVATTDIYSLPNEVLELYRSIRYCAIITKLSHILASKERQPAQFIVSEKDAELAALQSAIRHFSTPSWAMQFGEIYYTITRHEKIIGGTLRISKD